MATASRRVGVVDRRRLVPAIRAGSLIEIFQPELGEPRDYLICNPCGMALFDDLEANPPDPEISDVFLDWVNSDRSQDWPSFQAGRDPNV